MTENIEKTVQGILAQHEHRPEPPPDLPWIMVQNWENVFFISWSLPAETIRPLVPGKMEIDTYDGHAWLSQLPMHMVGLHLRDLPPIPGTATFPEINLRTYVRVNDEPGVFFFSIDAQSHLGSWVADKLFQLPYLYADMKFSCQCGHFRMQSRRPKSDKAPAAEFAANYKPTGQPTVTREGSLEHFLVERYAFFAEDASGVLYKGALHHAPWQVQSVEAHIQTNTIPQAAGIKLPQAEPNCHYSPGTQSILWPVVPISL